MTTTTTTITTETKTSTKHEPTNKPTNEERKEQNRGRKGERRKEERKNRRVEESKKEPKKKESTNDSTSERRNQRTNTRTNNQKNKQAKTKTEKGRTTNDPRIIGNWPPKSKNEAIICRKFIKNGAKRSSFDQKWSQEEQNGPKMEPRGAKSRSRSHKMAQDSAEEPPGRPNPGYGVQLGLQNGGQNRPKSMKTLIFKSILFFDDFSYRFFFDFRSKNCRKNIEKSIKQ